MDRDHLAEEIESMGRSEKRELISRLTVLLLHLLRWQFQPLLRGPSWRLSIATTRDSLSDHLDENPSLRGMLEAGITPRIGTARSTWDCLRAARFGDAAGLRLRCG